LEEINLRKGKKLQRGLGDFTLCEKCNNDTGSWYGASYVNWALQGMVLNQKSKGSGSLYFPFYIYPLRVIKQLITMFFQ
jgi:hypothetical protein